MLVSIIRCITILCTIKGKSTQEVTHVEDIKKVNVEVNEMNSIQKGMVKKHVCFNLATWWREEKRPPEELNHMLVFKFCSLNSTDFFYFGILGIELGAAHMLGSATELHPQPRSLNSNYSCHI